MDEVRDVMRLMHYSRHTERAYSDWIRRFVKFHQMRSRADLADGCEKVEAFLTHLAVAGEVALATQNQAMNALMFLYKRVLKQPLEGRIDALRATTRPHNRGRSTSYVMGLPAGLARSLSGRSNGVPAGLFMIGCRAVESGVGGFRRCPAFQAAAQPADELHAAQGGSGRKRTAPGMAGDPLAHARRPGTA